jgi:hypothetical protein
MTMLLTIVTMLPLTAETGDKDNKKESTPENSVLVYGSIGDQTALARFTQMDPAFAPGTHEAWSLSFFFDDIEPGSYLKLTYFESRMVRMKSTDYTIIDPGLQGKTPVDFRVPSKPGLYYIGCKTVNVDGDNYSMDDATWGKKAANPQAYYELLVLKKVLKAKIGTAWEPVIRARMEELEK